MVAETAVAVTPESVVGFGAVPNWDAAGIESAIAEFESGAGAGEGGEAGAVGVIGAGWLGSLTVSSGLG